MRSRRSSSGSSPPNGPVRSSAATAGVRSTRPRPASTTCRSPRAAGSSRSAPLVAGLRTGTSACASARRIVSTWARLRATTASSSHGTPSRRCRSRRRRAIAPHSRAGVVTRTWAAFASAVGSPAEGFRWMPAVAAPIRPVTALVRARSGAGWRCDSVRTRVGRPGSASTVPRRPSTSGSPPRKALTATSGSPNAMIAMPRATSARRIAIVPWVASCASSRMTSRRSRTRSDGSAAPSACTANRANSAESSCDGRDEAITDWYSCRKSATPAHSGRPWRSARSRRSSGESSYSVARARVSRSSVRNRRVRSTSAVRSGGQAGPRPVSRWPSMRPAMSASCSPPVMRRGAGCPAACAASATSSKAKEFTVLAIGPAVGLPIRWAIRSRSAVAVARELVSTSTFSGAQPRPSTRSATSSTIVVVLPVPGAPSTAADTPSASSTTARWDGSSSTGVGAAVCSRRNPAIVTASTVPARADRGCAERERNQAACRAVVRYCRGHSYRHRQQPP